MKNRPEKSTSALSADCTCKYVGMILGLLKKINGYEIEG